MSRTETTRTHAMRNNQAKLDELEYFLERLGTALFGPVCEDFRKLAAYVPVSANLSLLIDAARARGEGDVAVDFAFLDGELERGRDRTEPVAGGLFHFAPYLDLLAQPQLVLERIEPAHQVELRSLLAAEPDAVRDGLVRVNAYAWLELVGLPDLEIEFDPGADKVPLFDPPGDITLRGLEAISTRLGGGVGALRRMLERAHYLLALNYREQVRALVCP